jgi:hypothetical protein
MSPTEPPSGQRGRSGNDSHGLKVPLLGPEKIPGGVRAKQQTYPHTRRPATIKKLQGLLEVIWSFVERSQKGILSPLPIYYSTNRRLAGTEAAAWAQVSGLVGGCCTACSLSATS